MDLNGYQKEAERTSMFPRDEPSQDRLLYAAVGAAGEAGELINKVKKALWHKHPLDKNAIVEELGDILWYVSEGASSLGVTLEEVAAHNIERLKIRFPDGFSSEHSIRRVDVTGKE